MSKFIDLAAVPANSDYKLANDLGREGCHEAG